MKCDVAVFAYLLVHRGYLNMLLYSLSTCINQVFYAHICSILVSPQIGKWNQEEIGRGIQTICRNKISNKKITYLASIRRVLRMHISAIALQPEPAQHQEGAFLELLDP